MGEVEKTLYEVTVVDSVDREIRTVIESDFSEEALIKQATREASEGGFVAFSGVDGYPSIFVRTPQIVYIEEVEEFETEDGEA